MQCSHGLLVLLKVMAVHKLLSDLVLVDFLCGASVTWPVWQ